MLHFNRCVHVNNKCHQNIYDDVGGHDHEWEEEKAADDAIVDREVELVPDELPVVEKLHGEKCDHSGEEVVEIEPHVVRRCIEVFVKGEQLSYDFGRYFSTVDVHAKGAEEEVEGVKREC